jgi:Xaa-Pro aminopeptidase
VIEHAEAAGFEVKDYAQVSADVNELAAQGKLFSVDANKNNWATSEAIVTGGGKLRVEASPITMMKAIKNEAELQGCARAHVVDAVAIVKFLRWLEEAVGQGQHLTEVSVSARLLAFRQAHPSFVTPSFATIAGFASNGAIIHYHPQEGSNNKRIDASDMFLLDSGGQYLNGTTDITRTLHMGDASSHHKRCYTRVLQSHLQLQSALFPKGITGFQLDVIARVPLWKDGLEYGHALPSFIAFL